MKNKPLAGLALALPICFLLGFFACSAYAQNTLTFTAETETGVEFVTPILSWDTTPAADSCTASGDWSGDKGASGTETLAPISSTATYNMTCEWKDDTATLTWTAPTENTDGTALTDLAGFKVFYGATSGNYSVEFTINDPNVTTTIVTPLTPGLWFFATKAFNAIGTESDFSNEAQKLLTQESDVKNVGITVNPKPASPDNLTVL